MRKVRAVTPNGLEPIRAILLTYVIALAITLSGCASRPASATTNDSAALSATATSVVSPMPVVQSGGALAATATAELGTPTPDPGGAAIGSSATATSADAQPSETAATSAQNPATTPSAGTTPGGATVDPAAVPLFLTVTAPADELLEVPAGTASVTISGKTVPSAVLSVNGNLVIPDSSGNFQVTVPVDDDVTLVEVVASDVTGAELHVQRVIVRD